MNLRVRVGNKTYHVRIGSTQSKPIQVEVEGQIFEVWPDVDNAYPSLSPEENSSDCNSQVLKSISNLADHRTTPLRSGLANLDGMKPPFAKFIRAPIPGVITAVNVEVGSEVSIGQELLKLEAMKMNNSIRSSRSGIICAVHVTIGQIVKHNEILIEFTN